MNNYEISKLGLPGALGRTGSEISFSFCPLFLSCSPTPSQIMLPTESNLKQLIPGELKTLICSFEAEYPIYQVDTEQNRF